jgi:hypothetical protein
VPRLVRDLQGSHPLRQEYVATLGVTILHGPDPGAAGLVCRRVEVVALDGGRARLTAYYGERDGRVGS